MFSPSNSNSMLSLSNMDTMSTLPVGIPQVSERDLSERVNGDGDGDGSGHGAGEHYGGEHYGGDHYGDMHNGGEGECTDKGTEDTDYHATTTTPQTYANDAFSIGPTAQGFDMHQMAQQSLALRDQQRVLVARQLQARQAAAQMQHLPSHTDTWGNMTLGSETYPLDFSQTGTVMPQQLVRKPTSNYQQAFATPGCALPAHQTMHYAYPEANVQHTSQGAKLQGIMAASYQQHFGPTAHGGAALAESSAYSGLQPPNEATANYAQPQPCMNEIGTATPRNPFTGAPASMTQPSYPFTGHRHSHPSAVLSYGPAPPPLGQHADSQQVHELAAAGGETASPLETGAAFIPPSQQEGVQPSDATTTIPQPHQETVLNQDTSHATQTTPTLSMFEFVQRFSDHFRNCPVVLKAFKVIAIEYNEQRMTPQNFYIGVHRILYRTKARELLHLFQEFVPQHWKEGHELVRLYQGIEREVDDMLARFQSKEQHELMHLREQREIMQNAQRAQRAQALKQTHQSVQRETATETARSKVVVLSVQPAMLESVSKPTTPSADVDEAARPPAKKRMLESVSGSTVPSVNVEGAAGRSARKTMPRKKKAPVNGFRAQPATEDEVLASIGPTPTEATPEGTNIATLESNTATAPTETTFINLTPTTVTPAKRPLDDDNETPSSAVTAKQNNRTFGSKPASEVPHAGPVYASRRAVLAREDRPFIHSLCGKGFRHPEDVRLHHGRAVDGGAGHNCVKIKKGSGPVPAWDEHDSCKVGYSNINYCKVKDGYVILDQESFDKVQTAADAGRAFLAAKKADTTVIATNDEKESAVDNAAMKDSSASQAATEVDDKAKTPETKVNKSSKKDSASKPKVTPAKVVKDNASAGEEEGATPKEARKRVYVKAGPDPPKRQD